MPSPVELTPRYNICPTQQVACIRQVAAAELESVNLRWGLVPSWADDLKIGARMINARSETVADKPAFRKAFRTRRCLVIADGFYEWKKTGKSKQPFYISRVDSKPFFMAGLWESWHNKQESTSKPVETCTIITTQANELMMPLHDRMPVIMPHESLEMWLDSEFADHTQLENLLIPFADDELQAWPVDTLVNKAANDLPQCVEPVEQMGSLFSD